MERLPELRDSTSDRETYYGVPLLKEHVWKAAVPAYFYVGGVAGASAALGAAATWSGSPLLGGLVRKTRLIAAGGAAVCPALLIDDLGPPSSIFASSTHGSGESFGARAWPGRSPISLSASWSSARSPGRRSRPRR